MDMMDLDRQVLNSLKRTPGTGKYFSNAYNTLLQRLTELPSSDPSPNLPRCITTANFVRAEMLAKQHGLPADIVTPLQELAILQYFVDYKNTPSLLRIADEFGLSRAERLRLLGLISQEETYPLHSYSGHTAMAVNENGVEMWRRVTKQLVPKPSPWDRLKALVRMWNVW